MGNEDKKETFTAKEKCIDVLLNSDQNELFLIPDYQRPYVWENEQVDELLEDIFESYKREKNPSTFIGSMIFTEGVNNTVLFGNKDLKVRDIVDGQQRIITILLLFMVIYRKIHDLWKDVKDLCSQDESNRLEKAKSDHDETLKDILSVYSSDKNDKQYYATLIHQRDREGIRDKEYKSAIATKIQKCINKLEGNKVENSNEESSELQRIDSTMDYIDKKLGNIEKYYSRDKAKDLLNLTMDVDNDNEYVRTMISFLCLADYVCQYVRVASIDIQEKGYEFDVFESLNTRGARLTAIDTLKPLVVQESQEEYEKTGKGCFEKINGYLGEEYKRRNSRSEEITGSFLYIIGEEYKKTKDELHHKLLRQNYKESQAKVEYVKVISEVVGFYERVWKEKYISNAFPSKDNSSEEDPLFHMSFIRDTKTRLAIPIIVPYWLHYQDKEKDTERAKWLKEVCISLASFIAIWRGFTGGTGDIDNALRSVMTGSGIDGYSGIEYYNPSQKKFDKKLPSPEILKGALKELLKKKKIFDKEHWIAKAKDQPLSAKSKDLCRYLILISHNATSFDENSQKLKKINRAPNNYKTLESYNDPIYETIEHIAPKNSRDNYWKRQLKNKNEDILDTIGNLTLLPHLENSSINDRSWKEKKIIYGALTLGDPDEVQEALRKIKNMNDDTRKKISKNYRVKIVESLPKYKGEWIGNIEARSQNLLGLAWEDLAAGVGLKK